ncbi:MAG: N-acetylmuramoyl-L-alanine amidase [Actinomycetota bacterium]|nr:N-acetylmuramoyl-L-alanine amidase [Actinomycetota bacterium]
MNERPVLRAGSTGSAVGELQQCLADAGIAGAYEPDRYGAATEHAVREFQTKRGLRVDGVCGPETWNDLIGSAYELGDRLLFLSRPLLRGDDVATLQRRLNMLGFHAGREDGLFGPQTERALREFQLNYGLAIDGQCGRATLLGLDQVGSLSGGSAASVREREGLRSDPRRLGSRQLYVAADHDLARLGAAVARGLVPSCARVLLGSGRPDSVLAEEANRFGADVVVALRAGDEPGARVTYFATPTFRSERGYSLAVRMAAELDRDFGPVTTCGRAYGILRETRMAAVECQPAARDDGDELAVAAAAPKALVDAIIRGVRRGVEEPLENG